jgi:hypothetical protein
MPRRSPRHEAADPPAIIEAGSVFLNVPFDSRYRTLLIALVAGLTAIGRKPHCVLEVPSSESRLERIYELPARCEASVHDLSRVSLSGPQRVPRFNMPFEAGIAWALRRHRPPHAFFLLEEKDHRLEHSLNDLNGYDVRTHKGTQSGILRCLLDCFVNPAGNPEIPTLRRLTHRLSRVVAEEQRRSRVSDPFHPHIFRLMVAAATQLAESEGLLR